MKWESFTATNSSATETASSMNCFSFSWTFQCSICCHFSRFYQVRCWLRVTPRLSAVQIEASVLDNLNKESTSATVIRGAGTSKNFQILYRNEEVILKDTVLFRVRLPGNFLNSNEFYSVAFSIWMYLHGNVYMILRAHFQIENWAFGTIIYKIITSFLCFVYFLLIYSMFLFSSFLSFLLLSVTIFHVI